MLLQVSDLRQIPPSVKPKLVKIGWKHRFDDTGRYLQQKVPIGGTQELELNMLSQYSVTDIIEISKKKFASQTAMLLLQRSDIKLGLFNHTEFESFSLPDGTHCGLWDFYRHQNWNMSRMHLYLLTTLKKEFSNDEVIKTLRPALDYDEAKDLTVEFNEEQKEVVINKNMKMTMENVNCQEGNLHVQELLNIEVLENVREINHDKKDLNGEMHDNSETIEMGTQEASEQLIDATSDSPPAVICTDDVHPINDLNSLPEVPASSYEVKAIRNNFNQVDVLYSFVTISKYSGECSIGERDKTGMYWTVVNELGGDYPIPDEAEFDPLNHGYDICRIVVNNNILLKLELDENVHQSYIFPSANCEEHAIAHDVDEVIGFSLEYFGLGIIPKCIETCKPTVTWYCNNVVYKEVKMGLWLHNVPITNNEDIWHCEVTCKSKGINNFLNLALLFTNL